MYKVWLKVAEGVIEEAYQLWHGFLTLADAETATKVLMTDHAITDPQGNVVKNTGTSIADKVIIE